MEVIDTNATQICIFETERLPFAMLLNRSVIQELLNTFSLVPVEDQVKGQELRFAYGRFPVEGSPVHIQRIGIGPRRMLVQVAGTTYQATALQRALLNFIDKQDLRENAEQPRRYEPVVTTNESTMVFTHESDFQALFGKSPLSSVEKEWQQKIDYGARVNLEPVSINWRVTFDKLPEEFSKYRVTLADKQITIETRGRHSNGKTLYALTAPVKTEQLDEFAAQLVGWLDK